MTFNSKRLSEIDRYIKTGSTGTPEKFAKKLSISLSTLKRCIRFMRKRNAPIRYNYFSQSYYYEEIGSFVIEFRQE